jgi:transposase-like protein
MATKAKAQHKKKTSVKKSAPAKKVVPAKHAVGRPAQYKPEYNEQVVKLCLLGATDKAIADFFSVSTRTLNTWKKQYPEFLHSLKRGKEQADANVVSALYSRATGFVKHGLEEVFQHSGKIVRAEVSKYYPPEVTAGIFWLKNRQPDKWREKQTQVLENPDGTPLTGGKTTVIFKDYSNGV